LVHVQHGDEQQRDRFVLVQHPGVERLAPQAVRVTKVGVDHRVPVHVANVVEQDLGVRDGDRFVVDVDHAGVRIATRALRGLVGDLMGVAPGRHTGPDVEELAHPDSREVADDPVEEQPVGDGDLLQQGKPRQHAVPEFPVDRPVRGPVEEIVVNPGHTRPIDVHASRWNRLRRHLGHEPTFR
jgi:hypothetical protein